MTVFCATCKTGVELTCSNCGGLGAVRRMARAMAELSFAEHAWAAAFYRPASVRAWAWVELQHAHRHLVRMERSLPRAVVCDAEDYCYGLGTGEWRRLVRPGAMLGIDAGRFSAVDDEPAITSTREE